MEQRPNLVPPDPCRCSKVKLHPYIPFMCALDVLFLSAAIFFFFLTHTEEYYSEPGFGQSITLYHYPYEIASTHPGGHG